MICHLAPTGRHAAHASALQRWWSAELDRGRPQTTSPEQAVGNAGLPHWTASGCRKRIASAASTRLQHIAPQASAAGCPLLGTSQNKYRLQQMAIWPAVREHCCANFGSRILAEFWPNFISHQSHPLRRSARSRKTSFCPHGTEVWEHLIRRVLQRRWRRRRSIDSRNAATTCC